MKLGLVTSERMRWIRLSVLLAACATSLTACRACDRRREDRRADASAPAPPSAPAVSATSTSKPSTTRKRVPAGRAILALTESVSALAADDEAVYAIGAVGESRTKSLLSRLPLDGSGRAVLADVEPLPAGPLAHDETDVYFVVRGSDPAARTEIRRVPKKGGAVTTLFDSEAPIVALAVEPGADGIVHAATERGPMLLATKTGTRLPPEAGEAGATTLVVDGDTTYGGTPDRIWARKVGGRAAARVFSHEGCNWMASDATHLYCARPRERSLEVVRVPKADANARPEHVCAITVDATTSAKPRAAAALGLAVDGQRIYASASHATRSDTTAMPVLFACPKSGGAPSVIVMPPYYQRLPVAVARGDLVWAELDSTTETRIVRAKEPAPDALDLAGCFRDDATGRTLVTSRLVSDLDPATAIAFVSSTNRMCGDTYCEGDYDFFFHDVRCSATARSCHVSMRLYGRKAPLSASVASIDVRDGPVRGRVVGYEHTSSCKPSCMNGGELSPCSTIDVICEIATSPPFEIMSVSPEKALSPNLDRCIRAVEGALRRGSND